MEKSKECTHFEDTHSYSIGVHNSVLVNSLNNMVRAHLTAVFCFSAILTH
jgi:hypothetical protein